MHRSGRWLGLIAMSLVHPPGDLRAAPPTLEVAAKAFAIPDAGIERLRAGEIVTRDLEPAAPTELGIALAVVVKRPLAPTLAFVASDEWFEQDRDVVAHGALDPDHPDAGLANLALGDSAELRKLLQARPGDELNLSAGEIARLHAVAEELGETPWKQPGAADAVSAAYRSILAARVSAYRRGGIDAIEPYERGGGKQTAPSTRLSASLRATPLLRDVAPGLAKALTGVTDPGSVKEHWLWLQQVAQDRPVVVLSHRISVQEPGAVFAAERQFFVGHSWDCALVLGGLVETDSGTLLVYANRLHTDAVSGGMGGMKRSIGRGMMEKSLRQFFERVKSAAEARSN
jgi:hypothetical protein